MKELVPVLEKLATQLGTTSTYLWGVLIKQAYIDGILNIIFFIISVISAFIVYKLHIKFMGKMNDSNYSWYHEYEVSLMVPMVFVSIFVIFFIGCGIVGFLDSFTAFYNPEYWALNKILTTISKK